MLYLNPAIPPWQGRDRGGNRGLSGAFAKRNFVFIFLLCDRIRRCQLGSGAADLIVLQPDLVRGRLDLTCGARTWPMAAKLGRVKKKKEKANLWPCDHIWPWLAMLGRPTARFGRWAGQLRPPVARCGCRRLGCG